MGGQSHAPAALPPWKTRKNLYCSFGDTWKDEQGLSKWTAVRNLYTTIHMNQRISRRPLTAEAWVQTHDSPSEIYDWKRSTWTVFSPSTSVFGRF
jgi:hypothetical protein